MISIRTCPESRAFYDRKRAEKKTHKHAVLALAPRRVNVLFAMIRDGEIYQSADCVTPAARQQHEEVSPGREAPVDR